MAKRESLEALLSPSLRVSRPVAACSKCRAAKIKCDGKLPACTACERSGKAESCSGANDEFAKGKERSYVAALEATLKRLQKRLAEAKILQATDPSRRDSLAASYMLGPGHALSPRRIASGGRVHRKEASDVDNLVGDFGFLSVNATSRDFHGFTATMSFARLLLAASKTADLPQADTRSLPARYTITPLIQNYLDNIFVLMPFFSETDFMASVAAVYADAGRYAKPKDQWMVRMVLAIVAANSSEEKDDGNYRLAQQHIGAALGYTEDVLHPGSIAGIQAILLLVQYSLLDPYLFSCWHLMGFASRVMVDLGLHNEPRAEFPVSKDESEMRRRVFYCVYALDRNISIAFGRAFTFTDDSASVPLPGVPHSTIPADPGREPGPQLFLRSLQPSLYLFDIRRVQSSLYQETRLSNRSEWPSSTASAYTNSILSDVRSWFNTVPAALSQNQIVFFQLESLYSQIVALAPSCRIPNISELHRTLIFEYAIQYADQLHPITRDNNWHAFFTVAEVHRIDFTSRQFVSVMWEAFDHLLSGALPHESPVSSPQSDGRSTTAASPPSPNISRPTSALENTVRAMRCLNKTLDILSYASKRFGKSCSTLHSQFEQESAVLINKLRMKQQELGTVQYITGGPPQPPPIRPDVGPPVQLPLNQGMQMLQPLQNPQQYGFQQQQQQQQQQQPPQQMSHVSYSGSLGEEQQFQQDLMVNHQMTQPPRLVRHVSHGAEPYGNFPAQPHSAGATFGGAGELSLMPEGSLPRRSYEFLGSRRPGQGGGGG
jgi:Fungal specific transcription factor domain/Fungal Zn(2)-Cys(6) binuclear cluster domain